MPAKKHRKESSEGICPPDWRSTKANQYIENTWGDEYLFYFHTLDTQPQGLIIAVPGTGEFVGGLRVNQKKRRKNILNKKKRKFILSIKLSCSFAWKKKLKQLRNAKRFPTWMEKISPVTKSSAKLQKRLEVSKFLLYIVL